MPLAETLPTTTPLLAWKRLRWSKHDPMTDSSKLHVFKFISFFDTAIAMGSISKVNICFVLCTLTRDYDGIKSRVAGCRNSGERKKRPVSSANLHSLIISLILSCHLLKVVFLPLSLEALAVNQTLLYLFLSES